MIEIMKGDKVSCPFDQEGKVIDVQTNRIWNNRVIVKITKGTLHDIGEIVDFKEEQVKLIEE